MVSDEVGVWIVLDEHNSKPIPGMTTAQGVPTLMVFQEGQLKDEMQGVMMSIPFNPPCRTERIRADLEGFFKRNGLLAAQAQ